MGVAYLANEEEELDHLSLGDVVLDCIDPDAEASKEIVPVPDARAEAIDFNATWLDSSF